MWNSKIQKQWLIESLCGCFYEKIYLEAEIETTFGRADNVHKQWLTCIHTYSAVSKQRSNSFTQIIAVVYKEHKSVITGGYRVTVSDNYVCRTEGRWCFVTGLISLQESSIILNSTKDIKTNSWDKLKGQSNIVLCKGQFTHEEYYSSCDKLYNV